MPRRPLPLALALGAALALAPARGQAHGDFPETFDVRFGPSSSSSESTMWVPTSFGLLTSHDGGASWRWICEQAIGYGGSYRPSYAVTPKGTLLATSFLGLRRTVDGCTWSSTSLDTAFVAALTVAADGTVYVGLSSQAAPRVVRSGDDGATFVDTGAIAGDLGTAWKSLEAAPGRAERLYLTAVHRDDTGDARIALYRTDDAGKSWVTLPVGDFDVAPSAELAILAVSPDDPDLVIARVSPRRTLDGDAIYRSTNGGAKWTKVLDVASGVPAAVVRRYAGAGEPAERAEVVIGTKTAGTFVSTDGGATFRALATRLQIECLRERADGELYVCAGNFAPDELALGHGKTAEAWQRSIRFQDLAGPVACPDGTAQRDQCEAQHWCGTRETLGVVGADPICDGTAPMTPDAGPDVPGAPDAGDRKGSSGGCASGRASGGAVAIALGLAIAARRRRAYSSP